MFRPLPASKWNASAAAHLLNRAGFGGAPSEIARLKARGPEGAVSYLVDCEQQTDASAAPPPWARPEPDRLKALQELRQTGAAGRLEAQRQEQALQRERIASLRQWWLQRMIQTSRPLQEKLTLFWHGHFATSMVKVRDACFMWLQNETLRHHAMGNWLDLLMAISKDPAMLIWLSEEFYAADIVRHQIKSPVQWLVSAVRLLERAMPPDGVASQMVAAQGQELFAPPSVNGWQGGSAWITTSTLWTRYNQAAWLVYGKKQLRANSMRKNRPGQAPPAQPDPPSAPVQVHALLNDSDRTHPDKLLNSLSWRLFQAPLSAPQRSVLREYLKGQGSLEEQDILETIRLLLSTPDFQLT